MTTRSQISVRSVTAGAARSPTTRARMSTSSLRSRPAKHVPPVTEQALTHFSRATERTQARRTRRAARVALAPRLKPAPSARGRATAIP